MAKLKLEGIHPRLDGEYDFDETYLTNFELHAIKMATGLTAGDVESSLARKDNDANVALALVALMRNGKIQTQPKRPWDSEEMDALWAARLGAITSPEDDAGPPEVSANGGARNEGHESSGEPSEPSSESLEIDPNPTGDPTSDISDLVISET